jgi:holo-[acyl-carrier protein] synthase
LGIDLVDSARIARLVERHGVRAERRLFTAAEIEHCRGRFDRALGLAARFAAKEAFLKALGLGIGQGVGLHEIEVVNAPGGQPRLVVHGAAAARLAALGVTRVHVSLTHDRAMAAAVVLLEREPR